MLTTRPQQYPSFALCNIPFKFILKEILSFVSMKKKWKLCKPKWQIRNYFNWSVKVVEFILQRLGQYRTQIIKFNIH